METTKAYEEEVTTQTKHLHIPALRHLIKSIVECVRESIITTKRYILHSEDMCYEDSF